MTKAEFIEQLSSGYSDGMVVETVEVIVSDGSSEDLFGVYDFTDLQSLLDFFSLNYDEEMVRTEKRHGTKIISFSLRQRESSSL